MSYGVLNGHSSCISENDSADEVYDGDYNACFCISLYEFAGTIHGAVKFTFLYDVLATFSSFGVGDVTGVEVGVDGHLFSWHCIENESCADFADSAGTFCNDDKLYDDDDHEHDQADDEVTAGDKVAECIDDGSGISLEEDEPGGGDVESETEEGGNQQQRGEC